MFVFSFVLIYACHMLFYISYVFLALEYLFNRSAHTARPFKGLGSFIETNSRAWNSPCLLSPGKISAQHVLIFGTSASLF